MDTDNCIEEKIKERIAAGNRAYHVHKKLFSSKLMSRNVKLQIYNINSPNSYLHLRNMGTSGKYLALQEQMMATGGLKLIKK